MKLTATFLLWILLPNQLLTSLVVAKAAVAYNVMHVYKIPVDFQVQ